MKVTRLTSNGHKFTVKSITLTDEFRAILDGLLLGDGSYIKRSLTAHFSMSQIIQHEDWVFSLKNEFEANGLFLSFNKCAGKTLNSSPFLKAWSHGCIEFLEERMRWYPEGVKIVPRDLILTPSTLAHWHMGDGNASVPKGRLEIKLHTNGFTENDVELLSEKFQNQLGLHSIIIHWRTQPIIVLQHKNAASFISMVKPFLTPSFAYKVPNDPWSPPRCKKCESLITGESGTQRYVKYCDSCASPRMRKFRTFNREIIDRINFQKNIARWKREGKSC